MRSGFFAIAVGFLCLASPALAHAPPPLYVTVRLTEEQLTYTAVVGADLFQDWFGLPANDMKSPTPEQLEKLKESAEDLFAESARVVVDGLTVKGVFEKVEYMSYMDHGQPWDFVHVTVAYGTKGRAREIGLVWRKFDNGIGWYLEPVDAEMYAYEGWAGFAFTEKEPEFVWHAPLEDREVTVRDRPGFVLQRDQPLPSVPWTLVALGAGTALLALAAIVLQITGAARRIAWPLVTLLGISCIAAAWATHREIRSVQGATFVPPPREDSRVIFEALHRNIYRAFDFAKEDDIYDTLAMSVSGDLLAEVYAEVFQSLILAEEGGARCKVEKTEILRADVKGEPNPEDRRFEVDCEWQVQGLIGHWGHTHRRLNQYHALYEVSYSVGGWKITGVNILEQRRIDPESEKR